VPVAWTTVDFEPKGMSVRHLMAAVRMLCLSVCIGATSADATPCPPTNKSHCYAISWWRMEAPNEQVQGQFASDIINQASVPNAAKGDRINNETWTLFGSHPYWIEDGIYVGHEYGTFEKTGHTTTTEPVWFYALDLNDGSSEGGYIERDYTYGPTVGSNWWMYHLAEGNNTWCAYFNNSQAACYNPAGFETYTKWVEEGLEDLYTQNAPVNNGTQIGEVEWSGLMAPGTTGKAPVATKHTTLRAQDSAPRNPVVAAMALVRSTTAPSRVAVKHWLLVSAKAKLSLSRTLLL
jgi:hypothetical protein